MVSCFLTAKPSGSGSVISRILSRILLFIDINLTFMLGIYNYLCTFLDVRQGRHPCTLLVLSFFLSDAL